MLGTLLGGYIGQGLLSKLLAVFLLYMGISEIYGAFRTKKSDTQNF
ncbi:MAG TPA: hypothetical protein DEQ02_08280 [Ruminococcaceae bacterium]|nr:hypothetical protein [Oscillospiraceae bacterium]